MAHCLFSSDLGEEHVIVATLGHICSLHTPRLNIIVCCYVWGINALAQEVKAQFRSSFAQLSINMLYLKLIC